MDNEVMELIDELYSMVSEAWGVPWATISASWSGTRSST